MLAAPHAQIGHLSFGAWVSQEEPETSAVHKQNASPAWSRGRMPSPWPIFGTHLKRWTTGARCSQGSRTFFTPKKATPPLSFCLQLSQLKFHRPKKEARTGHVKLFFNTPVALLNFFQSKSKFLFNYKNTSTKIVG